MSKSYNDDSIELLIGAERIRTRPASMLGSSGLDGARHGFTEIYGNALDEHSAGYGDRLDVHYYEDGSVSVRDYGRGVPLGWSNKWNTWNWHNIYNELYGGGKYSTNQDKLANVVDWDNLDVTQFDYLFSVGLNGLGAASTQYTSEFFEVRSYRDGECKSRKFERGIPLVNGKPFDMFSATLDEIKAIPEEIESTTEPNGTFIHWKPDSSVFSDINIGGDWLLDTCKDISGIAGIELHFTDDINGVDIIIDSGDLTDVLKERCNGALLNDDNGEPIIFNVNKLSHGTTTVDNEPFIWVCKCDVVFGMTKKNIKPACFHNSVRMLSGAQYEGIEDAIAQFMTEKAKAKGLKLEYSDYEDALGVVVSTYSNYASFRNQTKDAVDDMFIYNIVKTSILDKLQIEYGKGNKVITDAVERVLYEAEIRISSKQQAKLIKEASKVKKEKEPEKFVSCEAYEEKHYDKTELWITEGDSAKGAVKEARDKKFQAIYPIRGKGLNVMKTSIDRILKNTEIREMFSLIGTGFDLNIKGEKTFNIDDLKFDKIIFATDADEDGFQIRVLLFLTFYKLAPQLILDGHVFIAETPRFKIDLSGGKSLYALNDTERDKILNDYIGQVVKVSRYKGLGEVNPDILRETTVSPETRHLIPVTCDLTNDLERELIDALFGADKYKQRKSIITTVLGAEVADMLEENALLFGEIEDSNIEEGVEYQEV